MARSSRMCGRARRLARAAVEREARRAEAQEMHGVGQGIASAGSPGSAGRSPGKHGGLGAAVEHLATEPLAGQRHADDAGQPLPARARFRLARRPQRGERHHLDLGAGKLGARDRLLGQKRAGSPPAGRGWCDADDRLWWPRTAGGRCGASRMRDSQVLAPGLKHVSTASSVRSRSCDGVGAGIDGRERIHQHDLAVEPREVVAEERFHHVRLVALEAAREHGAERAVRMDAGAGGRQRKERQQRRACEIAGQQEAAGAGSRERGIGCARVLQVAGEQAGAAERDLLVGGRIGIERGEKFEPRLGGRAARCRCWASATAPLDHVGEVEVEQRQIDQPFAGIVDDVDMQAARHERAAQRPCGQCIRW